MDFEKMKETFEVDGQNIIIKLGEYIKVEVAIMALLHLAVQKTSNKIDDEMLKLLEASIAKKR